MLMEILSDLWDCSYDEELASLLEAQSPTELVKSIFKASDAKEGLVKALGKWHRMVQKSAQAATAFLAVVICQTYCFMLFAGQVISNLNFFPTRISDNSVPTVSLVQQVLQPGKSSTAQKKDAENLWKQVVEKRKKIANISVVEDGPVTDMQKNLRSAFSTSSIKKGYKPKLGESHLLVVMSADLIKEQAKEPWATFEAKRLTRFAHLLKFSKDFNAKSEVVIAFDGCDRQARACVEKEWGQNGDEFVFIYSCLALRSTEVF